MPTWMSGDMWTGWETADLFLVTTNAQIDALGRLIMGAGSAKSAVDRWPTLPEKLGAILAHGQTNVLVPDYHLLVSKEWPQRKLGLLQTKRTFWEPSDLALVRASLGKLLIWMNHHPGKLVSLPYPGVGLGKLPKKEVRPLLERFPTSLFVWENSG